MTLSVIIVNYNCKDDLEKCLSSLSSLPCEIIVVDNNSSDGSVDFIKNNYPQITLVQNKENFGFAKGVNCGIKKSSGDYILILNPDTEIRDNIFELLDFMKSNNKIAAVGPKLLNSDGTYQRSFYDFPTLLWAFFHFIRIIEIISKSKILKNIFHKYFLPPVLPLEVDWITGACICISRKAIEDVGLFDENFFLYFEEIDWCKRARQRGWKICYFPYVEVLHHIAKASCKVEDLSYISRYESMFYYFKKHHKFESAIVKLIAVIIFSLRLSYHLLKNNRKNVLLYKKLIKISYKR